MYLLQRINVRLILITLIFLCTVSIQVHAALIPTPVNAQWGFLNQSSEVVIDHQFERVGNFVDGLAAVRLNDKEGYIDTKGEVQIATQFAWAADFSDKIARVNVGGTWDGTTVTGGKWGYIDQAGKVVIEAQFEDARDFSEGLAAVCVDGKWGYVDKRGKIIIKPRFTEAWRFSQSLALVRGSTYFYINPLGKTIIEPQKVSDWSQTPGHFSEDLARVKIREKWGYIDRRGNLVLPAEYDNATEFENGLAAVQFEGKWGYITRKGILVIQPQYEWADRFYDDRAIVKIDGKLGFIDPNGKLIIPAQYDEVTHFSEGLAAVKTLDGWGYLDLMGNLQIQPSAQMAGVFSSGLAPTRIGPGWGYIDDRNQFVIPPKFDWADTFSDGLAFVQVGELYGCIDSKGEWVIIPQYIGFSSFQNGVAVVSTAFGDPAANIYIDTTGKVVQQFSDFLQANCRKNDHLLKDQFSVLVPDGLKVFQNPDLNSGELGLIQYGNLLQVIENTFKPVELDGIKGHWAVVEYNGEHGYVFDGFLSRLPAPELGISYVGALKQFFTDYQTGQLQYSLGTMRLMTSPSGILRVISTQQDTEVERWDIYIPGVSIREAFLLVRTLAHEEVIRLNGQPVAAGILIKDIPFIENNNRIVIEVASDVGQLQRTQIIIEKERFGYIHIYEL